MDQSTESGQEYPSDPYPCTGIHYKSTAIFYSRKAPDELAHNAREMEAMGGREETDQGARFR